jgi:4-amino-4-deoxy-L-arabinose transferase-like glycosyltransferase
LIDETGDPGRLDGPGRTWIDHLRHVVSRPSIPARRALVLTAALCLAFLVVAAQALAVRSPLGHDESVYALRSRDLLDGWTFLSGDYWRDYRAPGLPMLLSGVGRIVGVHVTTARAFVVLLAIGILIATVLLGARLRSWSVGVVAAALLLVTYGFVLTSTTLLADTPGAAFALVAVVIYLKEMDERRLRWSFVVVPLAALVATLSRFGAPFMIAAGLTAVALVSAPSVLANRQWRLVVQSVVLAVSVGGVVALVVLTDTFSLFGESPASANSRLVGNNEFTLATGLGDLENVVNPWSGHHFPMWSKAVGTLFLIGLIAAVVSAFVERSRARPVVFGLVAGMISLFAVVATVGLVVPNYLMLTIPYWALVAATGWDWIGRTFMASVRGRRRSVGRWVVAVTAGAFVLLVVDVGSDVRSAHQGYVEAYGNIRTASVVTQERLGDSCILIARYTPQAGYYSRCRIVPFQGWDLDEAESLALSVEAALDIWDLDSPPDDPFAAMLVERAIRQPDLTEMIAHRDLFDGRLFEAGEPGRFRDHVVVEVVAPCVPERTCPSFGDD